MGHLESLLNSGSAALPSESGFEDLPSGRSDEPRLAARLGAIIGSPLRALLSSAEGPAPFDLAGGIPDPELFPSEAFALAAERVLRGRAHQALQYAPTEGLSELREWFALRLRKRGAVVSPEQILITHGSQHGLATVALLTGDKGSPVAIEQPAFLGAEQAFASTEARLLGLPIAEDGWDVQVLRRSEVRAIYVNPDYQNPTGRVASHEARLALARAGELERALVIEDDAYAELSFDGSLGRPIFADSDATILLGTLSKTLCPGVRVGFIAAPLRLVEPLTRLLQASTLQPGTLAQALALDVLQNIDFEAHRRRLAATYRARARALKTACELGGVNARSAKGGFYLWVETARATETASVLRRSGLSAVPESAFRAQGLSGPDRHLRLSFSRFDPRSAGLVSELFRALPGALRS